MVHPWAEREYTRGYLMDTIKNLNIQSNIIFMEKIKLFLLVSIMFINKMYETWWAKWAYFWNYVFCLLNIVEFCNLIYFISWHLFLIQFSIKNLCHSIRHNFAIKSCDISFPRHFLSIQKFSIKNFLLLETSIVARNETWLSNKILWYISFHSTSRHFFKEKKKSQRERKRERISRKIPSWIEKKNSVS